MGSTTSAGSPLLRLSTFSIIPFDPDRYILMECNYCEMQHNNYNLIHMCYMMNQQITRHRNTTTFPLSDFN